MEKRRMYAPSKIDYLGAYVFKNAKLLTLFIIHNFQNPKCFFPKSEDDIKKRERISKSSLKIARLRQDLRLN